MTEIITCSLSRELREKIDLIRGDISRSKYIRRLIENAIKSLGEQRGRLSDH
jgi:metal-responsive CopG/Arc/MetJ family transcriptional regulator